MQPVKWYIQQPSAAAALRLYCFSYAGGSAASYQGWQAALGPGVEVCAIQLPGRGNRFSEQPYTSLQGLVRDLAQMLQQQDSRLPFAFFGHSLGALVSFELARYCHHHYLAMPEQLFVSGCDAPQHRSPSKGLYKMPDDELIVALQEYNGTPPEILAHQELMALMLPVIRADFSLAEDYQYRPGAQLKIPLTVLVGKLDDHIQPEQVDGWQKESSAACVTKWFEGDHFFINSEREQVLEFLRAELSTPQYA
ncbi:putative thioesterase involved in non-ribosomal peptide biosynthesis [Janthinobacterium sp. HH01]|uniref:thioesterase II family protein n=1 Tax=Janthinobacterium sp. HH01 TaxID=1198452 RepID=UPI0002AEC649|nr:alpha/beta fold hydrolase [Janthinobacterium sp. HH01]ELX13935.1 putative thioesterase involved in non-ribosomal peptide biosynthesis [Janthinobacterium sp. HH01]